MNIVGENGKSSRSVIRSTTMRDVARVAQVSQSTVSRVLNSAVSPATAVSISEDTARRVQDAARELNYQPNLAARSLRGQKTQLIAVMIADISNAYYHVMVRRIQDVAREHGYDVLIFNSDHDAAEEHRFLQGIIRRPADGVIMTPYHLTAAEIDEFAQRSSAEVAILGHHAAFDKFDRVYANDYKATFETVQWLIRERQHERIAYIGVPHTHPGVRRERAYVQAMQDAGLPIHAGYIQAGDFTTESGMASTEALLDLDIRPTAIVACNDLMAMGCLVAAEARGLRVPADIAIVGFDDIPEASRLSPKLTTIAQHSAEMGERLAQVLFERIEAKYTGPGRAIEVPCELVVRESA